MPAPRDIIDALECVASIYFSDVRHKTRAAFILADELVEMCCKALALAANPNLGNIQFPAVAAHGVLEHAAQPDIALRGMKPDDAEGHLEGVRKNGKRAGKAVFDYCDGIKDCVGAMLIVDGECRIAVLHLVSGSSMRFSHSPRSL